MSRRERRSVRPYARMHTRQKRRFGSPRHVILPAHHPLPTFHACHLASVLPYAMRRAARSITLHLESKVTHVVRREALHQVFLNPSRSCHETAHLCSDDAYLGRRVHKGRTRYQPSATSRLAIAQT